MSITPRMTERHANRIELVLPADPGVKAYRIAAANTLDTAFAGATTMFTVPSGGTYRSPGIVGRRLGFTQYHNRGLTRALYDPEDFWAAAGSLPHDADIGFLRVTQISHDGVAQAAGPILIVPPPAFFVTPRPSLTIVGSAPNVAVLATGLPPPGAMHIVLPRFSDNVRVRNTDAADELLIAFGTGQPEITVPLGQVETFYDAAFTDVYLHSDGAAATFEMRFSVVNGEMS